MVHFEKQSKWETYTLPLLFSPEGGCAVEPKMPRVVSNHRQKGQWDDLLPAAVFNQNAELITTAPPGAHRQPSTKLVEH